MRDISTNTDIELLVNTFYDKVKNDETIGHIFHQIIGDDWSHHLPVMYRFWSMVLLAQAGYTGNPVKKHVEVDKHIPLLQTHYNQWLVLWRETVDELFQGVIADTAKQRAEAMMQLIDIKVKMAREGKSIV